MELKRQNRINKNKENKMDVVEKELVSNKIWNSWQLTANRIRRMQILEARRNNVM